MLIASEDAPQRWRFDAADFGNPEQPIGVAHRA
jgi:hypothetical protein